MTDIQQGMLPCDEEILTFMEENLHRSMVLHKAYMDEMEEMLDTVPCSHNDDHTSILAYDSQRTISVESPGSHSGLFGDCCVRFRWI